MVFLTCSLPNVLRATTACTFWTSNRHRIAKKWSEHMVFFTCSLPNVLRATTACTLWTSNRHRIAKKWSEHLVFLTFSLPNVLRATPAGTFSTSQLPKVVRDRHVLTLFTSTCASRHNCVQFFISRLARCLRTRRFSEPTFRP